MALVTGDADQVRVGPGKLWLAPYGTTLPTAIDATLDAAFKEIGFTTEGSALTYSQTAEGVEVAERLRPVKTIITAVEMTFEFTMAQISPENLRLATNSPAESITTSGDTVTFTWPKSGGSARQSIVWQADDDLEMLVLAKCFAGGDITIPRRKGTEPAAIGVTFTVEENASGADAYLMTDASLVA